MKLDKRRCDRCAIDFNYIKTKEGPPYMITKRYSIQGTDIDMISYNEEDYCEECLDSFYAWRNNK